jgi:hypothetical protein
LRKADHYRKCASQCFEMAEALRQQQRASMCALAEGRLKLAEADTAQDEASFGSEPNASSTKKAQ